MKSKTIRVLLLSGAVAGGYLAWKHRQGVPLIGRVVIITGGSRGLGLALARKLGAQGAELALIARDEDELHRAQRELSQHGIVVTTWPGDLCETGKTAAIIEAIHQRHGRIDVLINNAGEIVVGPFDTFSEIDFRRAMDVHLFASLATIKAVLPFMRARKWGRIVNVSSIGGKLGVPHLSPYCASKFALVGLSESLRAELTRESIFVTTVCPGLMRTGSHWNAYFKGDYQREFRWFALGASLPGVSMSVARAADQIVFALRRGQPELIISLSAQFAVTAKAITPSLMALIESLANRILPKAPLHGGRKKRRGWSSRSSWVPSIFTRAGDRAAEKNNELRGHQPPV